MIYFNIKTSEGVETIDELNPQDFKTRKEFIKYRRELVNDYLISGHPVYLSQRCTNDWRDN